MSWMYALLAVAFFGLSLAFVSFADRLNGGES